MKLGNSFFIVLIILVVSLLVYLVMQVDSLDKKQAAPEYTTVVSDWPVDYWRGGAGWSYPRYRDHPFYPMPNSPHPRPYPPHAPAGGHARHDGGHMH